MANVARFDAIRSLGFGSISGSYANVGAATTKPWRGVCFTNNTQGDMYFTSNTSEDQVFVKAGSFKLWDIQSNMNSRLDDQYVIAAGTQWSVKEITSPISGSVYIEGLL